MPGSGSALRISTGTNVELKSGSGPSGERVQRGTETKTEPLPPVHDHLLQHGQVAAVLQSPVKSPADEINRASKRTHSASLPRSSSLLGPIKQPPQFASHLR